MIASEVQDLDAQLAVWIERTANARRVPGDPAGRLVREALDEERPRLLPLPEHAWDWTKRRSSRIRRTSRTSPARSGARASCAAATGSAPPARAPTRSSRRSRCGTLIDRLVHHSEIISIEGESSPKREAEAAKEETATRRRKKRS